MDAAVKASDAISTGNSEVPDKVLHDKDEESPSKGDYTYYILNYILYTK